MFRRNSIDLVTTQLDAQVLNVLPFFVIACYMIQALESVAQWMHRWDDSLERGLTRARKIDSLNQESIVNSTAANSPLAPPAKITKKN